MYVCVHSVIEGDYATSMHHLMHFPTVYEVNYLIQRSLHLRNPVRRELNATSWFVLALTSSLFSFPSFIFSSSSLTLSLSLSLYCLSLSILLQECGLIAIITNSTILPPSPHTPPPSPLRQHNFRNPPDPNRLSNGVLYTYVALNGLIMECRQTGWSHGKAGSHVSRETVDLEKRGRRRRG